MANNIKKDRQELYRLLGDSYTEHIPLDDDHEIGTDPDCLICERFNKINSIMEQLEKELKVEKRPPLIIDKKKEIKSYLVTMSNGQEKIINANTMKQIRESFPQSTVVLLKEEELENIYIESDRKTIVRLDVLLKNEEVGVVAKKAKSNLSNTCHRQRKDKFIIFDGKNNEEVIDFCLPNQAQTTKKKNKVAIQTHRGQISASEGEVIVKNPFGNIELYEKEEFEYLYEVEGEEVWRKNKN